MDVRFLVAAVNPEDFPKGAKPEIVLVGRSNAGKSSFINALAGHKIAHVSTMPGKTETLNFYDFGQKYRVVDTPGFGYAQRSRKQTKFWRFFVENYFESRTQLSGVVLLMDCRRDWDDLEQDLVDWVSQYGLKVVLALTKADKLNQKEKRDILVKAKKWGGIEATFLTSKDEVRSVHEVEKYVFDRWIRNGDSNSSPTSPKGKE